MSKWIVDIHGEIEGDYELICKVEDTNSIDYDIFAKLKMFSNELKERMKNRDGDNGDEPLNMVDKGYHLAFEHLCKEIDGLLEEFNKKGVNDER